MRVARDCKLLSTREEDAILSISRSPLLWPTAGTSAPYIAALRMRSRSVADLSTLEIADSAQTNRCNGNWGKDESKGVIYDSPAVFLTTKLPE